MHFKHSEIIADRLIEISNKYDELDTLKLIDSDFFNRQDNKIPFKTDINLTGTRIKNLYLLDEVLELVNALPHDDEAVLLVSVASEEQGFDKSYICTRSDSGSIAEEVSREPLMSNKLVQAADTKCVGVVKIKAQYIKTLKIKSWNVKVQLTFAD